PLRTKKRAVKICEKTTQHENTKSKHLNQDFDPSIMEGTISNPSMEPLLFSVDPMSLFLTQNNLCVFERGPRYGEYATLRESKLRLKREYEKILREEEERFFRGEKKHTRIGFTRQDEIKVSPAKKRFGFNYVLANPNPRRMSSSSSSLAQSVPDFPAMIRKENRRPANSNLLPRRREEEISQRWWWWSDYSRLQTNLMSQSNTI
ncbi:unnamed protein product, partial [Brassica oleracea]